MKSLLFLVTALLSTTSLIASEDLNRNAGVAPIYNPNQEWEKQMVMHVKKCIDLVETANPSKLSDAILQIHGFSSPKVRHLLNNLCSLPGTVYLEIGLWKGSTFISALYGNETSILDALGVDHWTEYLGRDEFVMNCDTFLPTHPYRICAENCFGMNKDVYFGLPVNIYFYDGGHSEHDSMKAFTYFDDRLDDVFIAVVDDWNWDQVRQGTFKAFQQLKYQVLFQRALPAASNGDMEQWWNGLYVAVIRKGNQS